jgi:hypothetical protein
MGQTSSPLILFNSVQIKVILEVVLDLDPGPGGQESTGAGKQGDAGEGQQGPQDCPHYGLGGTGHCPEGL